MVAKQPQLGKTGYFTMTHVHYKEVSGNSQTGGIPVTTSEKSTCPPTCPLMGNGCYGEGGPIKMHWDKVSSGERAITWDKMCDHIRRIPARALWRHDVVGDFPHTNGVIDAGKVDKLVKANGNSAGFTYTHHDPVVNAAVIKDCNDRGFTVNLSANNARQADEYIDMKIGPVVTVLPIDAAKVSHTPNGHKIVKCPAKGDGNITCKRCGLCARSNRDYIIGFPAHGARKAKAHIVASG